MAIIFISIKKRQQKFFWAISVLFFLAVGILSFLVLLPELDESGDIVVQEVFEAPDVNINFEALDSAQVKSLEPFLPATIGGAGAGRDNPFQP